MIEYREKGNRSEIRQQSSGCTSAMVAPRTRGANGSTARHADPISGTSERPTGK